MSDAFRQSAENVNEAEKAWKLINEKCDFAQDQAADAWQQAKWAEQLAISEEEALKAVDAVVVAAEAWATAAWEAAGDEEDDGAKGVAAISADAIVEITKSWADLARTWAATARHEAAKALETAKVKQQAFEMAETEAKAVAANVAFAKSQL